MKKIIKITFIVLLYALPVILWCLLFIERKNITWRLDNIAILACMTLVSWLTATGIWYYLTLQRPTRKTVQKCSERAPVGSQVDQFWSIYLVLAVFSILGLMSCSSNEPNEPDNYYKQESITRKGYEIIPAYDYQICIAEDSLIVFDGSRYVGTIAAFDSSEISILLLKDNE